MAQSAIDDSRITAAKWLKTYMLKNDLTQADKVASLLSDGQSYKSHGKVINVAEAKDVLKLNAEMIDPNSSSWNDIWELYLRTMHFTQVSGVSKVFESAKMSLNLQVQVQHIPTPASPPPQRPSPSPDRSPTNAGHEVQPQNAG